MNKIPYFYTAMSKQVFLILAALLVISRFAVFTQVIIFDINGYAHTFNLAGTLLLYVIYLLACGFFLLGYKLFYAVYDENQVTYYNRLLRTSRTADLSRIHKAILNKKGIYLYYPEQEQPCLSIPFWRLGPVSPVGVDGLYKQLKSMDIQLEKTFTFLPGYGKSAAIAKVVYSCLALLTLGTFTQSLALAVAILKSH